ncbi:MAG: Kelch repeat-containing protein [Planctomycetota bacterium]
MGFHGKQKTLILIAAAALTSSFTIGCGGGGGSSKSASTVAPASSSTGSGTTSGTVGSAGTAGVTSATPGATAKGPGPELNAVEFMDADSDQQVSKGDKLVCTFVRPVDQVPSGLDPAAEFTLSVQGDSFGQGATIAQGQAPNQVEIVLGDDPRLYVSASFNANKTGAGAASGLNVAQNAAGILGKDEGPVQPAASPLDVAGTLTASFHAAGSMNMPRGAHNSVALDDGRILIVGGVSGSKKADLITEAELYDPVTETFVKVSDLTGEAGTMKRGSVKVGFFGATAVKLKSGDVLICGGYGVERKGFLGLGSTKVDTLESAFLFHPTQNTFERVGDLAYPRHSHTATLLDDGRVLIAGGYNESFWRSDKTQAPLEVFDPAKKGFSKLGGLFSRVKMQTPRMAHAATALSGGAAVLFSGGAYYEGGALFGLIKPKLKAAADSEVAIGAQKTQRTGAMIAARLWHASAEVAPDKVLAVGGNALNGGPVAEVELFDATTGNWSAAGSLQTPRSGCEIAFSRDLALVIGGHTGASETDVVEAFQRDAGTMASTRYKLSSPRNGCTVNQLSDGRVIVIGGLVGSQQSWLSLDGTPLGTAEVFVSN